MKFLLIRPPVYTKTLRYPRGPHVGIPLGLLYIAAALEREGVTVSLYDALIGFDNHQPERNADGTFHIGTSWTDIREYITAEKPDIVGISNPFIDYAEFALQTAQLSKLAVPSAVTVVGGPHPTTSPDNFLRPESGVDIVVRGEGERSIVQLVRALAAKKTPDTVSGISWRRTDGTVVHNPAADFIVDLDTLPLPAYHLIDMERYFRLSVRYPSRYRFEYPGSEREVTMVTSRGCPFHCIFCGNHLHMGRTWRFHSAENVLHHMQLLIERYGVRHFHLEDDNIILNRGRFEKILDGIADAGWNITWDTPNGVRAEGLGEELLAKISRSGCTYIIIGIESGNQRVLNEIVRKRLSLDHVRETARLCSKVNLDLHGFYVVGFPGESRGDINDTFDFALDLLKRYMVVPHLSIARPLPATDLHNICVQKGYLADPHVPNPVGTRQFGDIADKMIATPEFTPAQVDEWVSGFNRKVIRILAAKTAFWIFRHPLAAIGIVVQFVNRLDEGPVEALKKVFFGGVVFRGNYLRRKLRLYRSRRV